MNNQNKNAIDLLWVISKLYSYMLSIASLARKKEGVKSTVRDMQFSPTFDGFPSVSCWVSVTLINGRIFDWLLQMDVNDTGWTISYSVDEGKEYSEHIATFDDITTSSLAGLESGIDAAGKGLLEYAETFDFSSAAQTVESA